MKRTLAKETDNSIWQKNAKVIKKSNVKTIKELADYLRAVVKNKPLIKGLDKDDAITLLIDIGLSVFPIATKYKKEVQRCLKDSPEKINIENVLAALEFIASQNKEDASILRGSIESIKSLKIKSPFNEETPLTEHPLTAPLFRKTLIEEVILALDFGESTAAKLSKHYKSPDEFLNSDDEDIKKIARTSSKRIQKKKDALNWTRLEGVSTPLAAAFALMSIDQQDIIEMTVNDLQKIIKQSKISVPSGEKTQSNIKKINNAVRNEIPESAYYFDAISSLQLPQKFRSILKRKKVKTFGDLRKNGLLEEVIEKGKLKDEETIKGLKSYLNLSSISSEFEVNTKLIEKGYSHPYQITQVTRDLFRENLSQEIGYFKSTLIYEKAIVQSRFLSNIGTGAAVDAANGYSVGMDQALGALGISQSCHCRDCEAAVSPLAYLVDLLNYAVKHLRQSNDSTVNLSFLTLQFGQPFGALPASCKAAEREIRQVRVGIEVLRKQSIPSTKLITFKKAEKQYLLNTYQAILQKLGTSNQELRLARTWQEEDRERLAMKLGIELTTEDELGRLLLSNETGTSEIQQLTEENIEILFGLVDTTRAELSDGAKLNDPNNDLTRWNFDGVEWNKNTDEKGKIYLSINYLHQRFFVNIYCDSARNKLIAQGQAHWLSAIAPYGAKIKIEPAYESGPNGYIYVRKNVPNNAIEISLIPEFLCWKLKNLRKIWREADWTVDDYSKSLLPIIDPDLIGPDDIRTPIPQNPAYQLWETRRKWVDSQIKDTFDQITKGGGSPARTRSNNMLRELRQKFTYMSTSYRAWPNNYNLDWLDEIYNKIKIGADLELIEQALKKLNLSADELARLIEIKNKDDLFSNGNSSDLVTIEEWGDLISILVQVRKRTLFRTWTNEEEIPSIYLDINYFVIPANPPELGVWPLEFDVIIDPDLLQRENIRRSINKYPKIIEIYDDRKTALDTIYQRKQNEKETHGYPWLLEDSIKKVSPSITIEILKTLNTQLADPDTTISTGARSRIENHLKLKVEGEFDYLIWILLEEERGEAIKEGDWNKIYAILTKHEKESVLYGSWESDEKAQGINYWDVFPMHLAAWRSSNAARLSWQEALKKRSTKPVIDPDIIGSGHIRDPLNGRAADLWHERKLWVAVLRAALENEVSNSTNLIGTFDYLLQRAIYTTGEIVFVERWVQQEVDRYDLNAVLEEIFDLSISELMQLHVDLSALGTISEEAKHNVINNLHLSIPDYAFVIDIRQRDDSVAAISPVEWKSLYKILARVLQIREVLKLDAQRNLGHNINPYLTQMNLSYPAFSYLVQMRKLIAEGPNILDSEWANIFSILIQIEKIRTFPKWGREERGEDTNTVPILLAPDGFRIDEENGSTPWVWEDDPSSRWRASRRDLREWRERLRGRIKQQQSIITEFKDAIDLAEEQVLPELRSALIAAISGASNDENPARTLSDRFAISMEVGGCQKTTRISQAIKTIQTLLWSARRKLLDNSVVKLVADNFDEEWKWIGSYETWRAAMFVHLYPENLLLPSLRLDKQRTPIFDWLTKALRSNRRIDPHTPRKYGNIYSEYLRDVSHLTIQATCEAEVRIGQFSYLRQSLSETQNPENRFFMFALSDSNNANEMHVYWSSAAIIDNQLENQTPWAPVIGLTNVFNNENNLLRGTEKIIGAVPFETDSSKRYIHLFLKRRDSEKAELLLVRYDLDLGSWLVPCTLSLPGLLSDVDDFDCFLDGSTISPPWLMFSAATPNSYDRMENHVYIAQLATSGDEWHERGVEQVTFPLLNDFESLRNTPSQLDIAFDWGFGGIKAFHYISPTSLSEDRLFVFTKNKVYMYGRFDLPNYNPDVAWLHMHNNTITDPNGIERLGSPVEFSGNSFEYTFPTNDSSNAIYVYTRAPLGLIRRLLTTSSGQIINEQEIDEVSYSQSARPRIGKDSFLRLAGKFVGYPKYNFVKSGLLDEWNAATFHIIAPNLDNAEWAVNNSNIIYGISDLLSDSDKTIRREIVTTALEENSLNLDQTIYLREAYYFVPILLALSLQRNGTYVAALDWYRTIYDYSLPVPQREIYAGLLLERTLPDGFERLDNWFLGDQLNPHQIASTRAYTYTRFTIMSIIGCLIEYADAEFARDTDKSVARAAELYKEALELLGLDVLKQHPDNCDQIIGTIDLSVAGPAWDPVMMQLQAALSQINDHALLETTVNSVKKELAGGAGNSWRARLRKVNTLVNEAISKQSTAKTLDEVLTEQPTEIARVYDRLLQNPVVKSGSERVQQSSATRFTSAVVQATGLEEKELLKKNTNLPWLRGNETANPGTNVALQPVSTSNTFVQLGSALSYAFSTSGYVPSPTWTFCIPPNPILTSMRLYAEVNLQKIWDCRNIAGMKRELDPYEAPTDVTTGVTFLGMREGLGRSIRLLINPTQYRFKVVIARAKELVQLAQQMESAFQAALEKRDAAAYTLFKARQDEKIARASVRLQSLRVKEAADGEELAELQEDRAKITSETYQEWIDSDLLEIEKELLGSYANLMELQLVQATAQNGLQAAASVVQLAQIPDPTGTTQALVGGAVAAAAVTQLVSQLLVIEKQKTINTQTFLASHGRRKQEWEFQKALADQDILIGGQQITIAKDQVRIVNQEKRITEMQADHASDTIEFLGNQFFNDEMYEWMSGILERVYRFFLQQATSVARLAENQLVFERQEIPAKIIQSDYWEVQHENVIAGSDSGNNNDRRGLTGSARLYQDIYQLDQFAFETRKRKDILTKTFSLAAMAPAEFARFRETGVLQFATSMRLFDQELPGHYHRLIRRIRIGVLALIPPIHGIRAMLSTSGISRVVTGDTIFQSREIYRLPESITLTSPTHATEVIELQAEQAAELLLPFESMGVDTNWEFRLPRAGNRFDFSTITDILFSMDYTSLFSPAYYQQVVTQLDQRFLADHILSFKHQFPDIWYHLHNSPDSSPIRAEFEITRAGFPPNLDNIHIRELLLYISGGEKQVVDSTTIALSFTAEGVAGAIVGEAIPIDQTINTLKGNGGGWETLKNKNPFGKWSLEFEELPELRNLFENNELDDILFVISYSGDTPPWPGL